MCNCTDYIQVLAQLWVGVYQISALAHPESGHFFRNPAKSGSLQISSQIWRMPLQLQNFQLITDKTNAADLSSGVFAILIYVTPMIKIQKSLPFHKSRQNLANVEVTKEALNCTASLQQLATLLLLTPLVSSGILFCDPKTSSPQVRIRLRPHLSS